MTECEGRESVKRGRFLIEIGIKGIGMDECYFLSCLAEDGEKKNRGTGTGMKTDNEEMSFSGFIIRPDYNEAYKGRRVY
jgi:hypothetical protein